MKFHLDISPPQAEFPLCYKDKILLMGSCFAEEIGGRLKENYFNAAINPHGILFNPMSLCTALKRYTCESEYNEEDLIHHNNLWSSREHHGSFSGTDRDGTLEKINKSLRDGARAIRESRWLFITFGTSDGWFFRDTGKIAGNCHKLPGSSFNQSLIPYTVSLNNLLPVFKEIFRINPSLRVILTISPVRYIKSDVHQNNVSKAHLFMLVQELLRNFPEMAYFPAYELVTDDLRDYRFFKNDLSHPNDQAIDYVWEKFIASYLSPEDMPVLQEVADFVSLLRHRPLNPGSPASLDLKIKLQERRDELKLKYPFLPLG